MKKNMIIVFLLLGSVAALAQHDHTKAAGASHPDDHAGATFKDVKLGMAYEQYTKLKDALVASDAKVARTTAIALQKSLDGIPNGKKASVEAAKIATSDILTEQRKAFAGLSNEVATLVKGGQLSSGMIYMAYCPMANGGSYWLSNEKAIKNPYFGDQMLTCGSVKEMIQ